MPPRYSKQKGFEASTYVENVLLAFQSGILVLACATLRSTSPLATCGVALGYGAIVKVLAFGTPPKRVLTVLQVWATSLLTVSLIPQIWMNFQTTSGGQWSAVTAALSVAGNAIRVFTTLRLTKDRLLFLGFALGFALNATLLGQILIWGSAAA